jgi:hypothetical protein
MISFTAQTSAWETITSSASREIQRIVWNPRVHYRLDKSLPLDRILTKINSVHAVTSCFFKIRFEIHLLPGLASDFFASGFPTKALYVGLFHFTPIRATCPALPILFDMITPVIFWFQTSTAMLMKSAVFWGITRRRVMSQKTAVIFGEECKSWSCSLCSFLPSHVSSSQMSSPVPSSRTSQPVFFP